MAELFIASDDFTGALDTGVKLSRQGISARVVCDLSRIVPCPETVLVANLDTRHLGRDDACNMTLQACKRALAAGARCIYIKTDSGLRGNIGAALEAAARAVEGKVVFIPAYPALNRRTVNGVHMIGDVPVTQSVFGKDPLNPVKHDSVSDIIADQTSLPVYSENEAKAGKGIYIELLELNTDSKMLAYARKVRKDTERTQQANEKTGMPDKHMLRMAEKESARAYAGCAGFAEVLSTLLGLKASAPQSGKIRLPFAVFSASLSQINFEQMRNGEKSGLISYLFTDILNSEPSFERLIACAMNSSKGVLIESSRTKADAEKLSDKGEKMGLDAAARARLIALNMGRAAAALMDAGYQGTLCLFGGDILSEVIRNLKCTALSPAEEIEPGVVIAKACLPDRELFIVSKSGSFGSPDIIEKMIKYAEETI